MEYWGDAALAALWGQMERSARRGISEVGGDAETWLQRFGPSWRLVGRVTFHLAENPRSETHPFAFLATYTTRLSDDQQLQHAPLGRALKQSSARGDQEALRALLEPVRLAADGNPFIRELVDSGRVYQPIPWTPHEAHAFLQAIPAVQSAGVVVKVPDWWDQGRPSRPQVVVEVQTGKKSSLGAAAMLAFRVKVALGGEELSEEEWRRLVEAGAGLVSLRGKWIEVDAKKLEQALQHWRKVEAAAEEGRIGFVEGMRWIAGLRERPGGGSEGASGDPGWTEVRAEGNFRDWLTELHDVGSAPRIDPGPGLRATLREYQQTGLNWLHRLQEAGLGACLADDMGLGKTLQIIALLVARQKAGHRALIVAPASLLGNWRAELARFAPGLRVVCAHRSVLSAAEMDHLEGGMSGVDAVLTTYTMLTRLPVFAAQAWDLLILDEAQAIKNATARQTLAAKAVPARSRIAMTGTPVENGLGDLWSIFDFLNPGLLGSWERFRGTMDGMGPDGFRALKTLIGPFLLRRLKTDPAVAGDLPPKIEMRTGCALTKGQAVLYETEVRHLAARLAQPIEAEQERKALVLQALTRLKRICDHPALLTGSGNFDPGASGKMMRLRSLAGEIAARGEKLIVFTQFREMTGAIAESLQPVFRRPGLVLHGGTPVARRAELVAEFQDPLGPPFFVISLRAGGTGLNLTAATHVIHFDRWWNPAVENQATDRAYRIGQRRSVLVHKFVCPGTVEDRIDAMLAEKQRLADQIGASEGIAADWLSLDDDRLIAFLEISEAERIS
jgi:non-specific serine/threonine protein kinase